MIIDSLTWLNLDADSDSFAAMELNQNQDKIATLRVKK
jgi:hypothetical protein